MVCFVDMYALRYTPTGYVFISPKDDLNGLVDALLDTGYAGEFCVALDFNPFFIAELMAAGFLVMSVKVSTPESQDMDSYYLLLPKLHLIRSVLFFPDLHIKKSIRPLLHHYELRVDTDFDVILDHCVKIHDDSWLTAPLLESIKHIRKHKNFNVRPISFGVYRDGELKAGEIGILAGRVYTSYSGYYTENSAGTVQLILTTQYLQDAGFAFFDLGMPLEYKDRLGAKNIDPEQFVELFRAAQG